MLLYELLKLILNHFSLNKTMMSIFSLSGNNGLCGGPSLPSCPLLWENGGLSNGGKIAIGLACLVVFCLALLVVYMCCIRRGRNDYDFGLPQDLMCKYDLKEVRIFQFPGLPFSNIYRYQNIF